MKKSINLNLTLHFYDYLIREKLVESEVKKFKSDVI